jgi:hypothetical protein
MRKQRNTPSFLTAGGKWKPSCTWECLESDVEGEQIVNSGFDLAKDLFHGLLLVHVSNKGCELESQEPESQFNPPSNPHVIKFVSK